MADTLHYEIAKKRWQGWRTAFQISVAIAVCILWTALNLHPAFASHFFVVDNGENFGFPFTFSSTGDYVYRYSFSRTAIIADCVLGVGVAILFFSLFGRSKRV